MYKIPFTKQSSSSSLQSWRSLICNEIKMFLDFLTCQAEIKASFNKASIYIKQTIKVLTGGYYLCMFYRTYLETTHTGMAWQDKTPSPIDPNTLYLQTLLQKGAKNPSRKTGVCWQAWRRSAAQVTALWESRLQEIQVMQAPGDTWREPQTLTSVFRKTIFQATELYQGKPHFIINNLKPKGCKWPIRRWGFPLSKQVTACARREF